jgi:cytochrome b
MDNVNNSDNLLVWDLPLRLFHWGLAVAVIIAVVSVENDRMDVHERAGLTVLGLVVFRIFWGFLGGHHARFANFLVGPRRTIAWVRQAFQQEPHQQAPRQAWHSPLAAWSVLGLLGITLYLASTGPWSTDGILYDGPLAHLVPAMSGQIAEWHHRGKLLLIPLVVLHLAAILYYKIRKRTPLTKAMVTGRASESRASVTGADGGITGARLVAGLLLIAVLQAATHALPLLRPAWY